MKKRYYSAAYNLHRASYADTDSTATAWQWHSVHHRLKVQGPLFACRTSMSTCESCAGVCRHHAESEFKAARPPLADFAHAGRHGKLSGDGPASLQLYC